MIIPSDLNKTFDDFKVELISIDSHNIKYDAFTFHPKRYVTVKVNGVTFNMFASISAEMLDTLKMFGIKINKNKTILDSIKPEIILKYLNSKSYIRKTKLEKLNNINK